MSAMAAGDDDGAAEGVVVTESWAAGVGETDTVLVTVARAGGVAYGVGDPVTVGDGDGVEDDVAVSAGVEAGVDAGVVEADVDGVVVRVAEYVVESDVV